MRAFALVLAVLALAGCPKRSDTHSVSGTDDEQMDQLVSKLEELKSRMAAANDGCPQDACRMASEGCGYSQQVCAVAERSADRTDFQERCGRSQEDCARFNDTCDRCR